MKHFLNYRYWLLGLLTVLGLILFLADADNFFLFLATKLLAIAILTEVSVLYEDYMAQGKIPFFKQLEEEE